jgi:hypothetical protein
MPWNRWQVFEKVGQALNNNIPMFHIIQPLALEQLFVAVDMLNNLRVVSFSDEVKTYMAGCVLNDQVFFVPPPLDFIQLEVSQPQYHCKDCGNTESALFSDGYCSFCTERLHPEQGLSLAPKKEALDAGKGKNVETIIKYDPTEVAKLWKSHSEHSLHSFADKFSTHQDDENWVQLSKLLIARDYMNVRRKQLAEQLTTLKSWLVA